MTNSALSAVDTVQGFSATSDFDKLVIGFIGTNQYPGLASVHAAYHYQFLFQQMISPIKNWNVIDKDLFTQGTFLALESFFDALNGPTGTENPFILYRLGQCHIKLNKEDKGVEFLLKAYMLDGDSIFHEDPEGTLYLKTLKHKNLII